MSRFLSVLTPCLTTLTTLSLASSLLAAFTSLTPIAHAQSTPSPSTSPPSSPSPSSPPTPSSPPPATRAQLRACQNEAAQKFPQASRDSVTVNTIRQGTDGSAALRWQMPDGTYGFCRVSPNNGLIEFGVYPGAIPETSSIDRATTVDPLALCQHRLMQEFPGTAVEEIALSEINRAQDGSVALRWTMPEERSGFCTVSASGIIFELGVHVK